MPFKTVDPFRYLAGVSTLAFAPEKCVSCGRCVIVCPHRVFHWHKGRIVIQDRDACMECGACAKNCPTQAISVRSGVGCAYAVLISKWFKKRTSLCIPPTASQESARNSTCCGG